MTNTTPTTTAVRTQGGTVVVTRGDLRVFLNGAEARKPFVIAWVDRRGFMASGCVSRRAAEKAVRTDFGPDANLFAVVEVVE